MKIRFYGLLLAACLFLSGKAEAKNNEKPFVIPELQEWKGGEGLFTPTATSRIVYTDKDPEVARIANRFADDYALMFGALWEIFEFAGDADGGHAGASERDDFGAEPSQESRALDACRAAFGRLKVERRMHAMRADVGN